MIITIILLILAYSILGKPIDKLVEKIKDVNWNELTSKAWNVIKSFRQKAGCATCATLPIYMSDKNTSVGGKALISSVDFLPHSVLGWLGMVDTVAAMAFVESY